MASKRTKLPLTLYMIKPVGSATGDRGSNTPRVDLHSGKDVSNMEETVHASRNSATHQDGGRESAQHEMLPRYEGSRKCPKNRNQQKINHRRPLRTVARAPKNIYQQQQSIR